jgi:predicted kinase
MIINIRGTSGSGKTTATRALMERLGPRVPYFVEGRKRPLSYTFDEAPEKVAVVGSYESAVSGGCDTINTFDECYGEVDRLAKLGYHVIYEGVRQTSDQLRLIRLRKEGGHPCTAISLTTPLSVCLDSVRARRAARGVTEADKPLNTKNTSDKHRRMLQTNPQLVRGGVPVIEASRDDVVTVVAKLIGLDK